MLEDNWFNPEHLQLNNVSVPELGKAFAQDLGKPVIVNVSFTDQYFHFCIPVAFYAFYLRTCLVVSG